MSYLLKDLVTLFQHTDNTQQYGAHSVLKPFNKLIHLANNINQYPFFNKINL